MSAANASRHRTRALLSISSSSCSPLSLSLFFPASRASILLVSTAFLALFPFSPPFFLSFRKTKIFVCHYGIYGCPNYCNMSDGPKTRWRTRANNPRTVRRNNVNCRRPAQRHYGTVDAYNGTELECQLGTRFGDIVTVVSKSGRALHSRFRLEMSNFRKARTNFEYL